MPIVTEVKDNLILVIVFPIDSSNPTFVFISNNIDEVTNDKSAYKSFAYKPFIFIPSTYYSSDTSELYVKIHCEKQFNYQISISYREAYQLEDN